MSDKGVVLRCSWCKNEQRLEMSDVCRTKAEAELFLHLMTGGWSGSSPFPFRPRQPDDPQNPLVETQIGESACCKKQLEGETFGYQEPPCG